MLNSASAGLGLLLIAAGLGTIASATRRVAKLVPPDSPRPLTSIQEALPLLSAAQLFERTGTVGVLATIESKLGFSREHFQRSVPPLVHAYAEFVQQLPAFQSQRHAQPGGLLIRALEKVDFALIFRRGQILPRGAAPEDIMRLEHRWTYAVFVAALLHDIGRLVVDLRVTLYGLDSKGPKLWTPLSGSMGDCGATQYRVDVASKGERAEQLHGKLPLVLFQRWVPADILQWLTTDRALISELMVTLAGDETCGSGAIKSLVLRAEAELVKRNGSLGSRKGAASADGPQQVATPDSADDPTGVKEEIAAVEGTALASGHGDNLDRSNGPPHDSEEYLDDVEDIADDGKSQSAANNIESTAPRPRLLAPVAPALPIPSPSGSQEAKAPPEAALRFMSWLQAGLADGTLTFNRAGAMVHFVSEGMLLVSPRIFQHFAHAFGEDGRGEVSAAYREKKDLGMVIQKQLLKAGWHRRGESGINILPYQVLRAGKPAAPISGVVIANPERFVNLVPPANSHVVRLANPAQAVREHGLFA